MMKYITLIVIICFTQSLSVYCEAVVDQQKNGKERDYNADKSTVHGDKSKRSQNDIKGNYYIHIAH